MRQKKLGVLAVLLSLLVIIGCPKGSADLLSVSPNVIGVGSPDTQISLVGRNFAQPIAAVWQKQSAVLLSTIFVDSSHLLATVPASLLTSSGTASVYALQGGQNQTQTQSLTITIGNVAPTLTACAPCHAIVGAAATTVTLTGTNFNSTSVVNFTVGTVATPLSTTFVSSTSLTAVIPTTSLSAAGVDKLSVSNPGTGGGTSSSLNFTVVSQLAITTTTLPGGSVGVAYSATLTASGGTAPYTWSIVTGTLPAGLSLNASTGVISGTPTTAGSSTITFQVTDSTGALARRRF